MNVAESPGSHDRRKQRSSWASEALGHQLQQVAQRLDLEMVVLADRGGNLWAASRSDPLAEDLAAELPRLELCAPSRDGLQQVRHGQRSVRVKQLQVRTTQLLLAARGARSARGLNEAAPGVARILSSLAT